VNGIQSANIARITGQSQYNTIRGRQNIDNLPGGSALGKSGWDISTGFCLGGGNTTIINTGWRTITAVAQRTYTINCVPL
jgi:hypothetical protein